MSLEVVTAATTYPVTLVEAKAHCRIDGTAEDDLVNGLIAAATQYVAAYTGRAITAQTLRLWLDDFADEMLLPYGPVTAVSSVKYFDTADIEQTLSASVYQSDLFSDPARVVRVDGQSWPDVDERVNGVSITYTAGYATCPAPIKHAILLLIGDFYRGRENTAMGTNQPAEMPHAVTALLCNYRSFAV